MRTYWIEVYKLCYPGKPGLRYRVHTPDRYGSFESIRDSLSPGMVDCFWVRASRKNQAVAAALYYYIQASKAECRHLFKKSEVRDGTRG